VGPIDVTPKLASGSDPSEGLRRPATSRPLADNEGHSLSDHAHPIVGSQPTQRATRMRLITRGGYNWTKRFPWIVEATRKVCRDRKTCLGCTGI